MDDVKTSGLKLSEIRPCDACGGAIAPQFYVVDVKLALFGRGAKEVLGLAGGFGLPVALAELFAPHADEAVVVAQEPAPVNQLYLCAYCYLVGKLNLPEIVEKKRDREKAAAAKADHDAAERQVEEKGAER